MINENIFTNGKSDLEAIRSAMIDMGFECDPISLKPSTKYNQKTMELEKAIAGFTGELPPDTTMQKVHHAVSGNRYVAVYLIISDDRKRKELLINIGDNWYKFHHVKNAIAQIKRDLNQ